VLVTGRSEARLASVRQSMPSVHAFVRDQPDPASGAKLCDAEVVLAFPDLNA
jgi:short-subunit dehydrogenase involved in D-alanine esterification of teichoic acids